ncbi:MAG: OB-fold domain-containing protein [Pseudomonadales bacterium]
MQPLPDGHLLSARSLHRLYRIRSRMEGCQRPSHALYLFRCSPSYHPFFRNLVPYVVAWVDLEEGPRILTNVVDVADVDQVTIGMPLELTWEEHEELSIPLFKPASS